MTDEDPGRPVPPGGSRWSEIDALFDQLLDLPPEARDAALEVATPDPELRRAVRRLLAATDEGGGDARLLSLTAVTSEALHEVARGPIPERIGPFRPVRELGSGGMGTVYLAERAEGDFRQEVAVKVLRRGLDTDRLLARFRSERRILAGLRHPNVAALVDGGSLPDGRPWLAMEYVEGRPLVEACEARGLGVRARVELLRGVASAVQEAHRNLVVHRDIKPSNVLLTEGGVPKLLDFGIAKLLGAGPGSGDSSGDRSADGSTDLTEVGGIALTPRYAAPEQRTGGPVTTATDVYQLGLLLAETVSGTPPTPSGAREGGPPGVPCPPGDLGRIVAMATHPDPLRRYRDAGALVEELDRWLAGRPVLARPDSLAYRTGRFLHRNPWAAPVALALLVLVAGWGWSLARGAEALRAERDRARAEAERATLERDRAQAVTDFLNGLFRAADPRGGERGDTLSARTLLERGAARLREDETLDPAVGVTLAGTLAETALMLDMTAEGLDWMRKEVDFAGRVHGPTSASVAEVLVRQARFLNGMRGFQEAAPRAAQAVEMLRAAGSLDSLALARGLLALSVARTEMDDLAVAREAAEAAYALVSTGAARGASPGAEAAGRGDPARPDTRLDDLDMAILSQLALLARRSGDVVEAERAYREMLALARETPDLDPGILAGLLNNLGMLLRTEGRGEEAEPLLRENLTLMRSSQDPADRNLEVAATNLAALLWQLERLDETEALLREEAERVRGVFPAPHWRVANREGGLATFLERVGRWPEALPYRDAQVEGFEAALGTDHSFTVQARIDRARVLVELGRLDEADRLLAECRAAIGRVSDIPDTSALAAAARAAGDRLAAARRGGEGAG